MFDNHSSRLSCVAADNIEYSSEDTLTVFVYSQLGSRPSR